MELVKKNFDQLTKHELYELLKVRSAIFVVEQTCPYLDIDGLDYDAYHVFYKDEQGKVLAYLRLFQENNIWCIGRVLTATHGQGLGGKVLHAGLEFARELKIDHIEMEAQVYAIGFYEREGFEAFGEEFKLDGIPHIKMKLDLK